MRVAIYARYSSDLQRATSIEDQIRAARRYANDQLWTTDEGQIYEDAGISGASIGGRPGLRALLAAAARRPVPFDVLLVDDSSRVARDIADAIRVLHTLTFFGVRVIYISQRIDSADEQAETLVAVHGIVDSLYLRELGKKTKRGLEGQQTRGFATGGRTFGYRTVAVTDAGGRREPNGQPAIAGYRVEIAAGEAAIVRRVFEEYASGIGVDILTGRLNREAVPGPRGAHWKRNAVKRLLANERYLGRAIWGQRVFERRPGTNAKVPRALPRSQWRIQERPELRIVSDDLWARARAREQEVRAAFGLIAGRTLVRGRNAAMHSRYLFSGFLRCGVCGGAVCIVTGGHGSPRYGCPASWRDGIAVCANRLTIRAKVADRELVAGLQRELLHPETVRAVAEMLAAALNAAIDQRPKQRGQIEDGLRTAKRKLQHLVDAIEAGSSAPTLLGAIAAREQEIARLQGELGGLDEPLDDKLAVIPSWVRQQLEDTAGLLADVPEKTKTVFRQMGVSFTLTPVHEDGARPFLRAAGTTEFANLISGRFPVSTAALSHPRSGASRTSRIEMDLPANHPGPGSRRRA